MQTKTTKEDIELLDEVIRDYVVSNILIDASDRNPAIHEMLNHIIEDHRKLSTE